MLKAIDKSCHRTKDVTISKPPIELRRLTGCDVNKDIQISDRLQLGGIDIEMKNVDRVFRTYIKEMEDKTVYRAEESISYKASSDDSSLRHALKNIRNRCDPMEDRFGKLEEKIDRLLSAAVRD